jgi:hypothetical protein
MLRVRPCKMCRATCGAAVKCSEAIRRLAEARAGGEAEGEVGDGRQTPASVASGSHATARRGRPRLLEAQFGEALILGRIKLPVARHRDCKRPQGVEHLQRSGVIRQHLRQAPVGHRAFIEIGADQRHAARLQPGVHFLGRAPPPGGGSLVRRRQGRWSRPSSERRYDGGRPRLRYRAWR